MPRILQRPIMLTIAVTSLLAAPLVAQQGAGAPKAVAQRVLNALAAHNASAFAADMHPEAMAAFKDAVSRSLDQLSTDAERQQAEEFFQGNETLDQIKALPPERFFGAYMGGVFKRMQQNGDVRMRYQILGQVPEGTDLMHIVYRATISRGDRAVSDVSLLTLRRSPGGWKALLSGDLRNLAGPSAVQ